LCDEQPEQLLPDDCRPEGVDELNPHTDMARLMSALPQCLQFKEASSAWERTSSSNRVEQRLQLYS
jgi:hypothetical protein